MAGGPDEKSRSARGRSTAKFCIMALELTSLFIRQRMSTLRREGEGQGGRGRGRQRQREGKGGRRKERGREGGKGKERKRET